MKFKFLLNDEGFNIIEGECPTCSVENSLIIMKEREIRKDRIKMTIKCILCGGKYQMMTELENA